MLGQYAPSPRTASPAGDSLGRSGPSDGLQGRHSKWITLMYNIKAKYSIFNDDIYNFNETGFIIDIITTGMVITTFNSYGKAKKV